MKVTKLDQDIAKEVLTRLGLNSNITIDQKGLNQLFNAWCDAIPFDNFWKRLQLAGAAFSDKDQMNPNHFFEIWLEHGLGGTCWTSTKAMYSLLDYLGFKTRYITGSMGDMGMPNHGSLVVAFENGKEFIVDTSILNNHPIEITGAGVEHPVYPVQIVNDGDKKMLVFEHVTKREVMPCTIMDDNISVEEVMQYYDVSIEMSLFNDCIYIRKNNKESIESIVGNKYYAKKASDIESKELGKEEISSILIKAMGFSEEIVAHIEKTNLYKLPEESMLLSLTQD